MWNEQFGMKNRTKKNEGKNNEKERKKGRTMKDY